MNEDFHSNFSSNYNNGDYKSANVVILNELGKLLVTHRNDFVHLLNECNVPASTDMSDAELINLFIESVGDNNQLALGASLLVNMNNRTAGFDGDDIINNKSIKSVYFVLNDNFSNAGGLIGSIADAAKGVSGTVGKGLEARNQKLNGPMIALQKKQDAKIAMQQSATKLKQQQLSADSKKKSDSAKTKKIIIISIVSVVVLTGIIITIVVLRKKK